MSTPPPRPQRPALSMQTEFARQQQLTTFGMLLLLLGPLTLATAGVVAGLTGRRRGRMAICALGGLAALVAAGLFWQTYLTLGRTAWATVGAAYQQLQRAQLAGTGVDYLALAQPLWPPLWSWWRLSILLAPLAALNLLSNRVASAEELEQARLDRQQLASAAQERTARQRVAKAPASVAGAMVLGVPLASGDLAWSAGDFFTYPADNMARHGAVIGSSGMGKSETVLRLAYGAAHTYGWKVFFIDCKGEQALQDRFVTTMRAAGASRIGSFPQQPLDGWRGDAVALLNRLLAVIDYSEPYYRDLTKMLLNLAVDAPGGPPRASPELLERLVLARLRELYAGRPELDEIDGLRPKDAAAAYNRYRAFFKALQGGPDGGAAGWSFDTVDAGYILLDGLTLKDQTASFGRYLIEDFAHYAARRKPKGERVLLIIDEYPVIAFSGQGTASLFEMVRFHGASIIITGQSYAGMGEGFDRILGAAETLILHRCGDPDQLLSRAGQRLTFNRHVGIAERGIGRGAREYATGAGYLAIDEELKIHPNDVKELPRGECFVIAGGQYQRVLVNRVPTAATTTTPAVRTSATNAARPDTASDRAELTVIEVAGPLADAQRGPGEAAPAASASEPDAATTTTPAYQDEDDS